MSSKISAWSFNLRKVHDLTCRDPAACCGIRPLEELLATRHYDRESVRQNCCTQATEAELLLHGIYHGFPIISSSKTATDLPTFAQDNYDTDPPLIAEVWTQLSKEVDAGRIIRLDKKPDHLSAVYIKDESNAERAKFRLISDFSKPDGIAINDSTDQRKFQMMNVQDIRDNMQPFAWIAKVDILHAFRNVGVHPDHRCLLCYSAVSPDGQTCYFQDTRLPFGLAISPEIFSRISTAIRKMLHTRGFPANVVYVDDYILFGNSETRAQDHLDCLLSLLKELGIPHAPTKTEPPTKSTIALGVLLETNHDGHGAMRMSVPAAKMTAAQTMASSLRAKKALTRKELESAIGTFNHLSDVIFSARCFYRRLVFALRQTRDKRPSARISVSADLRADLDWWIRHAVNQNGSAVVLHRPRLCAQALSAEHFGGAVDAVFRSLPGNVYLEGARPDRLGDSRVIVPYATAPVLSAAGLPVLDATGQPKLHSAARLLIAGALRAAGGRRG